MVKLVKRKRLTLQELMDKHKVSPRAVYVQLGRSADTVFSWRQRKSFPRVDEARKLAEMFGLTINDIDWGDDGQ